MQSTETNANTCGICGRTLTTEPNSCGSDCGGDCLHCMCFVVEDPDCLSHKLSCKEIRT
jgi:hypothetical protein